MKTYLVGGAVRDKLLGIPSQDRDWLVVGATPQAMLDAGFRPIPAAEFPIFIKAGDEYALARKERKSAKGYKGFDIMTGIEVTVEEDLLRRDLTINSMAMDDDGQLIDPYNGQRDLDNKVLRHTSPAFKEDPVRILRVARFMAQLGELGFSVAPETLALMTHMISEGEADNLTPERAWKETEKALKTKSPWLFFETLRACGALEKLMPELHALIDVPQRLEHHPENCVFEHTMLSLRQSSLLGGGNSVINFAVLMHDLGKAVTPTDLLPAHHGHEKTGLPLVTEFCDRLKVPNAYRDLAMKVTEYHLLVHKALDKRPSKIADLLEKIGALKNERVLARFLIACEADAKGRLGFSNRAYPQADYIREICEAMVKMDAKPIIEKYRGQQALIGERIRLARIQVACQVSINFLSNITSGRAIVEPDGDIGCATSR